MAEFTFSTHICRTLSEMDQTQAEIGVILEGLGANILKNLGEVELGKSIRIFIRDQEDKVVGGIVGDIFSNWVYISLLWVTESLRNQGYGTQLVRLLESEAIKLGCNSAHLDTYSFESRPLYERLGYELFAVLEDYPTGYSKYFMKTNLI